MREPTILTNTVVTQWKALKLWQDLEYLANHPVAVVALFHSIILYQSLAEMPQVQMGESSTFGFIDNKTDIAKAKVPGIELRHHYLDLNVTGPEFFKRLLDPSDSTHHEICFFTNSTLRALLLLVW